MTKKEAEVMEKALATLKSLDLSYARVQRASVCSAIEKSIDELSLTLETYKRAKRKSK